MRTGPASFLEQATIFYAPSTSNGSALMRLVAQAAACPADATRKSSTSSSFYRHADLQSLLPEAAQPKHTSTSDRACCRLQHFLLTI